MIKFFFLVVFFRIFRVFKSIQKKHFMSSSFRSYIFFAHIDTSLEFILRLRNAQYAFYPFGKLTQTTYCLWHSSGERLSQCSINLCYTSATSNEASSKSYVVIVRKVSYDFGTSLILNCVVIF